MGLCATAKGLNAETCYECGYLTFEKFRLLLAKKYNAELGAIYEKWGNDEEVSEEEINRYDALCNADLDIFLFHSAYDGSFTYLECKKIYAVIKDMHMDMVGHNYGVMRPYNMLDHWKNIFLHCAKHRVKLFFR